MNLNVESNCLEAVKLLDDVSFSGNQFEELLLEISKVKAPFKQCVIVHISKEASHLAYSFAKFGLSESSDVGCFNSVCSFVVNFLSEDVDVVNSQLGII